MLNITGVLSSGIFTISLDFSVFDIHMSFLVFEKSPPGEVNLIGITIYILDSKS